MKDIKGYEGLYTISSEGEVFSMRKQRALKHADNGIGYKQVFLVDSNHIGKWHKVHRLVITHFGPPQPTNKHETNHIDRNKANNNIDNLEWLTRSENILHAFRTGRQPAGRRSGYRASDTTKERMSKAKQKTCFTHSGEGITQYNSIEELTNSIGISRRTYNRYVNTGKPCKGVQITL